MAGGRIAVPAVLVGVGLLLVAGCSSSSGGGGTTSTTTAAAAPATTATAAPTSTAGGMAAAKPTTVTLVAQGISWKMTKLSFKADQRVTITVQNKDTVEHNFTFAAAKANKDVEDGQTVKVAFTAPGPGTYEFHCKYHPTRMHGTVTIT
jgi:plastocyanin